MSNTAIKQAIISLLGDFGAFSRKVIRVPLYQYQMQAVSYTHLDVYKRQAPYRV